MTLIGTQSQIVGLYSFPKSGNTWLRAIIAGLRPDIPAMDRLQHTVPDTHYGSALAHPWQMQGVQWCFYKSHHKRILDRDRDGRRFATDKVLYIHRHPLDVFCSYVNFASNRVSPNAGSALPFQYDTIDDLTADQWSVLFTIFLKFGTLVPRNAEFGNVFEHVEHFYNLAQTTGQVHMLRYEDLHDDFETSFLNMTRFLGLKGVDAAQVFAAADRRTQQNGRFFWTRQKGSFRTCLTRMQIQRFYDRWGDQLERMGYPCV